MMSNPTSRRATTHRKLRATGPDANIVVVGIMTSHKLSRGLSPGS